MAHSPSEFARVWNDRETYPTIRQVAEELGLTYHYCKKIAQKHRRKLRDGAKLPQLISRSDTAAPVTIASEQLYDTSPRTAEELLNGLRSIYFSDPGQNITRLRFREITGIADSVWSVHFGTFEEFKRQAGLQLNRGQHQLERNIARHVSVDHYRQFNERHDYADRYTRPANGKYFTIIGCSDLHDIECDPFFLRAFITAAKMLQPNVINFGGDIFDLAEFGKYSVDPREWDAVGRIRHVHKHIFAPVREACPNATIDFVEGNHELRLLRHLADATPALRSILSDLMGLTVADLFGLKEFEINYIAKGDLAAYSQKSQKDEAGKSYKIYEDALLVHHHPHARSWGLPGWNGHHHHWRVFREKNALRGAYQWMQLGCGHKLDASYCEGEFWDMGFVIAHINRETKAVNFEYIPVTDTAVVGGVYLERGADER